MFSIFVSRREAETFRRFTLSGGLLTTGIGRKASKDVLGLSDGEQGPAGELSTSTSAGGVVGLSTSVHAQAGSQLEQGWEKSQELEVQQKKRVSHSPRMERKPLVSL